MAILSETTQLFKDHGEKVTYKLLNDESVDETTSTAVPCSGATAITLLVESSAGVSGGVVTLEAARTADYTGTWQSLETVTTNAATATFTASEQTSLPQLFVRARISTVIAGGTIDAYIITHRP